MAQKRAETSKAAEKRNKSAKSELKTETKKLLEAIDAGNKNLSTQRLSHVTSLLDSAAQNNVLHRNKANRLKSRYSMRYAKAFPAK